MELAMNFRAFEAGSASHKLSFYVAHDGSMVRLASGLRFGKIAPLRWPALGSEIVMEVRRPVLLVNFIFGFILSMATDEPSMIMFTIGLADTQEQQHQRGAFHASHP